MSMRPENRALLVVLVGVLVVVAIAGATIFLTALPTSLPIPAGTTFTGNSVQTWLVHFNVSAMDVRLTGAWSAFDGFGAPALVVVSGSVGRPSDIGRICMFLSCEDSRYIIGQTIVADGGQGIIMQLNDKIQPLFTKPVKGKNKVVRWGNN